MRNWNNWFNIGTLFVGFVAVIITISYQRHQDRILVAEKLTELEVLFSELHKAKDSAHSANSTLYDATVRKEIRDFSSNNDQWLIDTETFIQEFNDITNNARIDNNPLILEELKKYIFRTSDKLERTHQSIKSLLSREQELAAICESHVSVDACEKLFEAVADCSEVGDSRLCNLAATAGNEFAITQVTLQFHRAAGENSVKGREQIND